MYCFVSHLSTSTPSGLTFVIDIKIINNNKELNNFGISLVLLFHNGLYSAVFVIYCGVGDIYLCLILLLKMVMIR